MATTTRRRFRAPCLALLLFACPAAPAQSNDAASDGPGAGGQPLFATEAALAIRLEAPFTTMMRERSDTEQLEGTLSYTDASGAGQVLDVKLRTRGIYRRRADTCEFAPIRLNFRKQQVAGTEFAKQDKLKLVTHCENDSDSYEQYVLKEYLAYRIFSTLSEYSFGARLLHATYVDTDRGGEAQTRYAFVIEDNDLLAERIGARKAEVPITDYAHLERSQAVLVDVFQYLIGNTDYSLIHPDKGKDCCHNIELFSKAPDRYIPIPYDFDFSGIVDARYAEPHPSLNMRSVVRRRYRGRCDNNEALGATLAQFRDVEASIAGLPATIDGMDDRVRRKAELYVEAFYDDIADAKSVERKLIKRCYSTD